MDSFLQSVQPTLPLVEAVSCSLDVGHNTTSNDVDTFLVGLSWPPYITKLPPQISRDQQGMQSSAAEAETEEESDKTTTNTFEIAIIDNTEDDDEDDDDDWNVRSDYEEKDHVYYMPPGTYRSYVLGYWKEDVEKRGEEKKDEEKKDVEKKDVEKKDVEKKDVEKKDEEKKDAEKKDDNEDQPVSNKFEIVAPENVKDDDDDNWNVRSDYQEKDFVYQMPPGTYPSYVLGYWKTEEQKDNDKTEGGNESDEKSLNVKVVDGDHNGTRNKAYDQDSIDFTGEDSGTEAKSSSSNVKEDIDDYLDLTTPQRMANRPQIPTTKEARRNLCRVCRNFHDAKNKGSEKRCVRLVKKLLSWRKKPHEQPCANCGLAVDRRPFVKRIFGVRRRTSGTY